MCKYIILKNDIEIKLRCVFMSFGFLFLSFINYPLTLFPQALDTYFQSHPLKKPTCSEALSSALPKPAQQTEGRWKIPGVLSWTFKWSFSITQICEICIFSFPMQSNRIKIIQKSLVTMLHRKCFGGMIVRRVWIWGYPTRDTGLQKWCLSKSLQLLDTLQTAFLGTLFCFI